MATATAQIGTWLNLPLMNSEAELLQVVERQLSPAVVQRLLALGLERSEIDQTVIPTRTLQHRRARREKLTIEESDRVMRLLRVLSATEALYGERTRALNWLRRPHPQLDNRAPLSLLQTDTGARIVEELLVQIGEGFFV